MDEVMSLAPSYRVEVSRKAFHLCSGLAPLIYSFIDRSVALPILVALTLVAFAVEALRYWSPSFKGFFRRSVGFMVRAAEWGRLTGATYVLVGATLTVWWFPKPIAIAVLLVQTFADTAASLVGLNFGRARFLGKSAAGSLAFFATALLILVLMLPQAKGVAFVAAAFATVVEALPALRLGKLELNDNLLVPLLTGALICLLSPQTDSAQFVELWSAGG